MSRINYRNLNRCIHEACKEMYELHSSTETNILMEIVYNHVNPTIAQQEEIINDMIEFIRNCDQYEAANLFKDTVERIRNGEG